MKTSRQGGKAPASDGLPAGRMCGCPGTITEEVRRRRASIFPMHQQSE
jgi:hypothetical protein